jgi:hypothetical protein
MNFRLPAGGGRRVPAAALAFLAFGFYAGIYALWLAGRHDAYFAVMHFFGINVWRVPFLDMIGNLSWGECFRRGIDVAKINPCDPLGRPFNYGPIFLMLPFSTRDAGWISPVQNTLFLATAALVLRPRGKWEWLAGAAALTSAMTLYGMERANLDLFIFVLAAAGVFAAGRGGFGRAVSYAVYFFCGAMKLYPFSLFATVFREKPKTALLLAVAAEIAIGAYVWFSWPAPAPPRPGATGPLLSAYNIIAFGAPLLPHYLGEQSPLLAALRPAIMASLLAVALAGAVWFARRLAEAVPAAGWSEPRCGFLLAGAILMSGCFFPQVNVAYRAVFLIFLLPGFFALARGAASSAIRRISVLAIWAVLFCLWNRCFQVQMETAVAASAYAEAAKFAFFVVRELVWWALMTAVAGIVLAFLFSSPFGCTVAAALKKPISR